MQANLKASGSCSVCNLQHMLAIPGKSQAPLFLDVGRATALRACHTTWPWPLRGSSPTVQQEGEGFSGSRTGAVRTLLCRLLSVGCAYVSVPSTIPIARGQLTPLPFPLSPKPQGSHVQPLPSLLGCAPLASQPGSPLSTLATTMPVRAIEHGLVKAQAEQGRHHSEPRGDPRLPSSLLAVTLCKPTTSPRGSPVTCLISQSGPPPPARVLIHTCSPP